MAITFAVILVASAVICTAAPVDNLPVLQDAPEEVLFTENEQPFLLECKLASGDPNGVKFSWTKDGKPLSLEGSDITQRKGEGSLVFLKSKDSDAGLYKCFAKSDAGTASTRVINVRKAYINAPKVTLQKVKPVEGKPFNLECKIPDSYPKPRISWVYQLINDPHVSNEVMDPRITFIPEGTLYVTSAEKKDANQRFKYVCLANTPASDTPVPLAEYVIDEVETNPNPNNEVYEQYTSNDMTVKAGEMTYLYCIYGGTPLAHPDWFKDGVNVNGNPGDRVTRYNRSKGKRLLINEVWLTDAGTYKCVADNEKSTPKEHSIKLTVVAAPKAEKVPTTVTNAQTGKDVVIPCRVAGVPAPKLTWTYNAESLLPSQRININETSKGNLTVADLTIVGAQPTDNGYYGCKAENEYGNIYSETLLNVA